jgi:hypothetical protein|tara:strand:- start:810 stop:1595 length:786 start_codon:yes stop_codon:yes gene_type:complete
VKYQSIRGKKHYVFETEKEYEDFFPASEVKDVVYWKDGEEGDWVKADDGGIVQLLRVSTDITHPNDRKNYRLNSGWCRTVVGTFLINKKNKMDTDFNQHGNRYTFSKTMGKKKNFKSRVNPTKREKIFATNVVAGYGPVKAYMDAFGKTNDDEARKKAVILLKQDRVVKEIEKSVMDVAKEMGLDHSFVLNKLKHLANYSEDDNIILQSTKEIGKVIGTTGTTIKQREMGIVGMFQGFSPDQLKIAERKEIETNGEIEEEA